MKKGKRLFPEFKATFAVYVRTDDGMPIDTRPEATIALLAEPAETIIMLMSGAPQDLAAILSGCVGVDGDKLVAELDSPAVRFIAALDESEAGQNLAKKIAACLGWANNQPDLRPFLYPNMV